jgi:hypothetical protein
MEWKIHVRRDGKNFQNLAHDLSAALAVAWLLIRDGIEVERIEGPNGFEIRADAVRALYFRDG